MNAIKCRNCHLVNHASLYVCQRCGFELTETVRKPSGRQKAPSSGLSLPLKLALAALAGFVAYSYFGGELSPVPNTTTAGHATAQPQPTLSLRSEYEQRQTGAYKNAIQNSPGLAQSQKRLEETQKLMQPQPAKSSR